MTLDEKVKLTEQLVNVSNRCIAELDEVTKYLNDLKMSEKEKMDMSLVNDRKMKLQRIANILSEASFQLQEYTVRF